MTEPEQHDEESLYDDEWEGEMEEMTFEEEVEEELEQDENIDWGFEPDENIFRLKNLKFKTYTTSHKLQKKFKDACAVTGNLYNKQFLMYLPQHMFRMAFYETPYKEYSVYAKFMKTVDVVRIIDVDANYDLIYHVTGENMSILKKLTLRNCNVNEELLKTLCPRLEECFMLQELDLSHNPVGDEGVRVICKYIFQWTFLNDLCLFDCKITPVGLDRLGFVFQKRKMYVTRLNLGRNLFNTHPSIRRLFYALTLKESPIEELLIPNCCLQGSELTSNFMSYLTKCKNLKYLDISFNLFSSEEEVLYLAELFVNNPALEIMILNFNPMGDTVLTAMINRISEAKKMDVVKTLYLENLTIPQKFAKEKFKFFNRNDIIIKSSGVRAIKLPQIDSFKLKLVKRVNFKYKKGKPRPRRDNVVKILEENLPKKKLKRVKQDDFEDALMMINNLEPDVVKEIVIAFGVSSTRANAHEFIEMYKELFPPKKSKTNQKEVKSMNKSVLSSIKRSEKSEFELVKESSKSEQETPSRKSTKEPEVEED